MRLEEYISFLKEKTKDLNELETIRYVYIDLGSKMAFDKNYSFGSSKEKRHIYRNCTFTEKKFNLSLINKTIICKSLAYLFEYILKQLEIDIITKYEGNPKKNAHVHNQIKLKDGRVLIFDLQNDMTNIQFHLRSMYFGQSEIDSSASIREKEIEEIDMRLNYISQTKYYLNDFFYLIQSILDSFVILDEKVAFLLENLDYYNDRINRGYLEFDNFYLTSLSYFLTVEEQRKIHFFDLYSLIANEKEYTNCIVVDLPYNKHSIYLYNRETKCFEKISKEELKNKMEEGLYSKKSILGLKRQP